MVNCFKKMLKDESGTAFLEYGLLAALVAIVAIGAITNLGTKLTGTFTTVSDKLKA
ncbi:hypothetical protein CKC_00745 [Candidatus Liberibacter solanacearum CLso-ZC1]|uniref:Flp/Fap pilin component n=1 Tax=Liberibacter solanacearum (strain CLso-ZC1) TaxID=658172 RepID=E4UC10_LIBSC|nr:Flp family type IVb pilin [Candidatus Liberibacter solanacearum]ADR51900.1 hypothetical protein CKC_00745 [Candidatus Liberibacter solanacearum CLso-ZC1]